jgi:glycine cleavage system H protein
MVRGSGRRTEHESEPNVNTNREARTEKRERLVEHGEEMPYPSDLKYTKDHEWVRIDGDTAEIGITDFAQQQLGDVVYVELPDAGRLLSAGEVFGSIESVKAASELFAPMSGEVIEVNAALKDHPEVVNANPHGTWMLRVRLSDPQGAASLLDSTQYEALLT